MNPNMDVVRCFGVEYNAEDLSEAILRELARSGTQKVCATLLCSSSPKSG